VKNKAHRRPFTVLEDMTKLPFTCGFQVSRSRNTLHCLHATSLRCVADA